MSNKDKIVEISTEENIVGQIMDFYKQNPNDKIWWTSRYGVYGEHLFSFDKKKIYNLFLDYPQNLTKEEKEIFDKENPYWFNFFNNN